MVVPVSRGRGSLPRLPHSRLQAGPGAARAHTDAAQRPRLLPGWPGGPAAQGQLSPSKIVSWPAVGPTLHPRWSATRLLGHSLGSCRALSSRQRRLTQHGFQMLLQVTSMHSGDDSVFPNGDKSSQTEGALGSAFRAPLPGTMQQHHLPRAPPPGGNGNDLHPSLRIILKTA